MQTVRMTSYKFSIIGNSMKLPAAPQAGFPIGSNKLAPGYSGEGE